MALDQRALGRLSRLPGVFEPGGADVDGEPDTVTTLAARLHAGPVPVEEQIEIAAALASILADIHREGVVHGNLNARSVVFVEGAREPCITGFSSPRSGVLGAMAPEQTGRTGRSVDQRTDLYGLGVILYEMATGTLPFAAADPLRLIHDVLATVPVPPARNVPGYPVPLSGIVSRLLEKEPDRRYQTPEGLVHDLLRLRADLAPESSSEAEPRSSFPLGENDFPARLPGPGLLVGREAEVEVLARALDGAVRGAPQGILVRGDPGVGKTILVHELRPMVTRRHGWFVSGKSDQYRRDLASDAVNQALQALGRLLLTEPESELRHHRTQLRTALGSNAGLIAALQPELALALGIEREQERPSARGGYGAGQDRDRVIRAAIDVLRAVASPQRPMVVFLDDLQWASSTSIQMIEALFQEPAQPGLLLVGAFRGQEVLGDHPLVQALRGWRVRPEKVLFLELGNLACEHLGTMISQMLRLEPQPALDLATVLVRRTRGNPFDTIAILNALREDGLLTRETQGWSWDAGAIGRHVGDGDVVDLLATRIDRLAPETGAVLRRMACLGGEVTMDLLGVASGLSRDRLDQYLSQAAQDGLVVLAVDDGSVPLARFRHDRVQQAASSSLDSDQRLRLHLELARRLADRPEFAGHAADQYLSALPLVVDRHEREQAIVLFRRAAHELRVVNPPMSEGMLAACLSIVDPSAIRLRIALETEHHTALYRLGRLEEADQRYESLERLGATPFELVLPTCERMSGLTFRERPREAVAVGLTMVRRLGVDVPDEDLLAERTNEGLARIRRWVASGGVESDLARPEASDPVASAVASLFNRMLPPAFFVTMPITPWLVFESQQLWARHGPCAALVGPLSHASFATILVDHDYRTGYLASRRVLAVCEDHDHEPETSQALLVLALSAAQWFEPLETALGYGQRALEGLIRGCDSQNTGFAAYCLIPTALECTPTLEEYLRGVDERLEYAQSSGNGQTFTAMVAYRQLARSLMGHTSGLDTLSDPSFDLVSHLQNIADSPVAIAYTSIVLGLSALFQGDYRALDRHSTAALAVLPVFEATLSTALVHLMRALALADSLHLTPVASGGRCSLEERSAVVAELNRRRNWLADRATDCRRNFEHLLHLVDAERAWAFGEFLEAAKCFDAACRAVAGQRRPWHASVIAERAAAFHLACGLEHSGRALLVEARDAYRAWGAEAKARELEARHAGLRDGVPRALTTRDANDLAGSSETVDLKAITRVCQMLSSETNLDRLHVRVREVVGALSGATHVRIVVWRDQPRGWFVLLAEDEVGPGNRAGRHGMPLDDPASGRLVPLQALRYAERTTQPLVVADVAGDDRLASDPYLLDRCCRSLAVIPILSHGVARAILFLEHRLASGAFTTDRMEVVGIVAGQLAVSLENALLYEELEERVVARTRELRAAQSELIATARRVGMAEIASHVLHNIGNVLTSVNVAANLAAERVRSSKTEGLAMAVAMLRGHEAGLSDFLTRDPRGRLLPDYLSKAVDQLLVEREEIDEELARLVKNVEHIMDIVATQQSHVGKTSISELTDVHELLEDALRVNGDALDRCGVTVDCQVDVTSEISLDKVRVLVILVNLVSNAQAALAAVVDRPRTLTLSAQVIEGRTLRIRVEDTGEGISRENLSQIFTSGFTTRVDGHGYGLHSCALAAREMGGTLTGTSEGPGRGAAFVLEIPVVCEGL